MNANLPQQTAQTPSPSTGSRQAMHRVGSAMSSASFARWPQVARKAPKAARTGRKADAYERISAFMFGLWTSGEQFAMFTQDHPRVPALGPLASNDRVVGQPHLRRCALGWHFADSRAEARHEQRPNWSVGFVVVSQHGN